MWKEAAVVRFKALSWNFPGDSEENHGSLRIAGHRAEILNPEFP
jgi:hypothetical protein